VRRAASKERSRSLQQQQQQQQQASRTRPKSQSRSRSRKPIRQRSNKRLLMIDKLDGRQVVKE
jgi:hypothetical protein